MFIFEKYILRRLVVVFVMTIVFFTGILFIFNVFKIARHLAAGLQFSLVLRLFVYLIPSLLGFSIPFGALVACLLVYGRLSAQNEILALRASGVSLSRVASAMAMLGVGTFFLSLFVFGVVSPKGTFALRNLRKELGSINPIFLFEPGKTINVFPGYSIYLRKKQGNELYHVVIHCVDKEGVTTRIDAERGTVKHNPRLGRLSLVLKNVTVIMGKHRGEQFWDEKDESVTIEFDIASAVQKIQVKKDESDMTFRELMSRIRIARENGENTAMYLTEFNKRLVYSFACLSFALIGAPLGMRIHRGEKTVGITIGIALAMAFYTLVMLAEKLRDKPSLHPELLMWLPNAILLLLGVFFFRRIQRGIG